jgi:hypothetical protein
MLTAVSGAPAPSRTSKMRAIVLRTCVELYALSV